MPYLRSDLPLQYVAKSPLLSRPTIPRGCALECYLLLCSNTPCYLPLIQILIISSLLCLSISPCCACLSLPTIPIFHPYSHPCFFLLCPCLALLLNKLLYKEPKAGVHGNSSHLFGWSLDLVTIHYMQALYLIANACPRQLGT